MGKKVGLVLGGGAALGIAHVGVLKVIERERIPVDLIVGVSAGSLIGGAYASGRTAKDLENVAGNLTWAMFGKPTMSKLGLVSNNRLKVFFDEQFGEITFENLAIPFIAVSADIRTGKKILIRKGLLSKAVQASAAIPVIFSPVYIDGVPNVDGGVADNLPVDVAKEEGCDVVIAVDVLEKQNPEREPKNIFEMILSTIYILIESHSREHQKRADILICPDTSFSFYTSLEDSEKLITAGETATKKAVDNIKRKLGMM